jgi:hypothetical protein
MIYFSIVRVSLRHGLVFERSSKIEMIPEISNINGEISSGAFGLSPSLDPSNDDHVDWVCAIPGMIRFSECIQ